MPFYIKKDPTRDAGTDWPKATGFFVKTDPSRSSSTPWSSVKAAFVKVSSTEWKQFWGAHYTISQEVDIALSTNSSDGKYILTGTNYKWSPDTPNPPDSGALTYKFTWYDGTNTSTLTGPTKIANGITGGTTYSPSAVNPISATHFAANTSNVYTFYVEAPDGTTSSKSISVQGPTDITLTEGAITNTTFDLSWTYSTGALAYLVYQSEDGLSYSLVYETTLNSATITDLLPGAMYYFYVTPITGLDSTAPGYYGNDSNIVINSTETGTALTPTFGTNTSTSDGFIGSVTNYNSSWTWSISASDGTVAWGTASGSTRPFTVSGLGLSSPSTVTVTTTRSGYTPGTATTTYSSAAGSGLIPTFGAITSTATGFDSSVTNYNSNWTWSTPDANNGDLYQTGTYTPAGYFTWGTPSGSTRPFSVTGLPPGTSVTAVITTTRTGYNPGTASIVGSSLTGNARIPTFGPITSIVGGFTGYVNNYDANWSWSLNGNERGTFSWGTPSGSNYPFSVTGLTPGQGSTLGIRTARTGYTDGIGSVTGYAAVTISYNGNGNTGGSTASTVGGLPLTIASNGFTRTNYVFRRWDTSAAGTDVAYYPGGQYNLYANLSLYAIWDRLYIVTWNANGGSVSPSSSQQTSAGGSVTAPTPSRSGYTFSGWYTAASGGSLAASGGGSYTPVSDITLYAQWTILAPSTPTLSHTKAYVFSSVSNNLTRITSSQKRQDWTYTVRVDYNLSWNTVANADSYEIGWSSTTTPPASATWTGLTGTSMTDYWYQYDRGTVTYYYFVRARNTGGVSAWSAATGGTSTATVVTGLNTSGITLVNATTGSTAVASPANTALTYTWTGVNTTANHYTYLTANIAGSQQTNVRGPASGSV